MKNSKAPTSPDPLELLGHIFQIIRESQLFNFLEKVPIEA